MDRGSLICEHCYNQDPDTAECGEMEANYREYRLLDNVEKDRGLDSGLISLD